SLRIPTFDFRSLRRSNSCKKNKSDPSRRAIRSPAAPPPGATIKSRETHRVRARARCTRRAMARSATGQEAASVVAPYEAVSSVEEIEAAKTKGIRFIQLQFTDIMGIVKAVTIPIHQLEG